MKGKETKRNDTKRNETKRNETKRNFRIIVLSETKLSEVAVTGDENVLPI
jgi:hypothetical protein